MRYSKLHNDLLKSVIVIVCFIFLTSFTTTRSINHYSETLVSVVQENDAVTVSVKTTKNILVRFYMFTVEGRLIKELSITGTKKISITQLEKGVYIYDFFSNDERLKNGKIELR